MKQKEVKFRITKNIESVLDKIYYLDYSSYPDGEDLSETELICLFQQIYQKGQDDALTEIKNSIYSIEQRYE